ncbi:MAG: peptidoglycan-binding protein [Pygmaiobacter sp.]
MLKKLNPDLGQGGTRQVTPMPPYPGTALRYGSSGADVALMQRDLSEIAKQLYPSIGVLAVDGKFGSATQSTVYRYQAIKQLAVDGVIGRNTWNAIVTDYANLPHPHNPNEYPGTPLRQGSKGTDVLNMQTKLNTLSGTYTAINHQTVDGDFGSNMAAATRRFQKQFALNPDEIIGAQTWNKIIAVHQATAGGNPPSVQTHYPGTPIQQGSSGDSVRFIQSYMNIVGKAQGGLPQVTVDGQFGSATKQLVMAFQAKFALKVDGIVGSVTWSKMIVEVNLVF